MRGFLSIFFSGLLLENALVFTNFQWGTFRLDEESANLLANWRAMLEESRFYGNLTEHISKQKSAFEDVSMLNGSQLEPSDAELA
jgi:hypothetical protein